MASWTDTYIEGASFRGVPFYVPAYQAQFGRNTVVHEYPGQDKPYIEDLGRKTRRITLECLVADFHTAGEQNTTHAQDRDNLIAEFEKGGSGELIHPWLGTMTVTVVGDVTVRESTKAGGVTYFSVPVIEAGEELEKKERIDTKQAVAEACDEALEVEKVVFETDYQVVSELPGDLQTNLKTMVRAGASKIRAVLGKISAVIENVNAVVAEIDRYSDLVTSIITLPAQIVNAVQGLVSRVQGIANGIVSAVASAYGIDEDNTLRDPDTGIPLDLSTATQAEIDAAIAARDSTDVTQRERADVAMVAFRDMSTWGDEYVDAPDTTPTRQDQLQAQRAVQRLHQSTAIVEACRVMSTIDMPSWDYASSVRDELVDAIDDLIESDQTTDASFEALRNLRAATVLHFEETAQDLPRIQYYAPPITAPAVLIAHTVFKDSTRADELTDRNNVAHPLFVRGGEDLEILADE